MVPLRSLLLFLPALIPSWRFFDAVSASPRLEYRLLASPADPAQDWRPFRPRPAHLRLRTMLARLLWNPLWNETLFLVSLSERLLQNPTAHSQREILTRIARALPPAAAPYLQVRLLLLRREGAALRTDLAYLSPILPRADLPA